MGAIKMGTDLRISEIEYTTDSVTFKRITTICNWEVIEELLDLGRRNWCLEGECGAEFELLGSELNQMKDTLEFEDNTLIGKDVFDDENWYRCSLSYQKVG